MNTLYISYDGLLDNLGQSQILPYIFGVRNLSKNFYIISFEKKPFDPIEIEKIKNILLKENIHWIILKFSHSKSVISKLSDIASLYLSLIKILVFRKIHIIHARGLPAASTSLFFKRFFKFKLIFDFRGLWADERVTKGGWDLTKPFHKFQYNFFKSRESKLFLNAEKIVVLTQKVLEDIKEKNNVDISKFTVIPCAADYSLFKIDESIKKISLDIPNDALVVGYLGSIGPMYYFREFTQLIRSLNKKCIQAYGLIITADTDLATQILAEQNAVFSKNFIIRKASRAEVPRYLNYMDALAAFYTDAYSVISVSPTKIGEALACGIPIICNSGIGDTDSIIQEFGLGVVLEDLTQQSIKKFIDVTNFPISKDRLKLREDSRKVFGLEKALLSYRSIYKDLF